MPNLFVIAGCNGSGKTTIAKELFPNYFNCNEFVNADIMAAEMSPDDVARVAITAGKKTLELVNKLFDDKMSFAMETTLSGNVHKKIIQKAQQQGYYVVLIYVWVESSRVSISRVKSRTKLGGHFVPKEDVIRRYKRGVINFFHTYIDLCDYSAIIDNSGRYKSIVAECMSSVDFKVHNAEIWKKIKSTLKKYVTNP